MASVYGRVYEDESFGLGDTGGTYIITKNSAYSNCITCPDEYSAVGFKKFHGYDKDTGVARLDFGDGVSINLRPTGEVIDLEGLEALSQGKAPLLIKSEEVIDQIHVTANGLNEARDKYKAAIKDFNFSGRS